MWEHFDACLKCTLCVSQCPVMSVNPDFPGPKALGPEWSRTAHQHDMAPMEHVDDCTFCQICESACPVDVPIAHLIADHKAKVTRDWRRRVRDGLLARPHLAARTAVIGDVPGPLRRLAGISPGVRLPRRRPSAVTGLGEPLGLPRGKVGLFLDCYTKGYDPGLGRQASELLRLWGFEVVALPAHSGCCGAAAYASGNPSLARTNGRRLKGIMEPALSKLDMVITLNATCDGTLRDEWPKYYGLSFDVPVVPFDEAAMEAPKEFWDRLRTVSDDPVLLTHTTCRGKVARGDGQLYSLAERAGYTGATPAEALCCGAAGSYAFKVEHEKTAGRLGGALAKEVQRVRAQGVMTDSGTCAIHIEQESGVTARHPAFWLYTRYVKYIEEAN
ncbi:hypothetical protein HIJ39_07785 [Sulfobacillus sp. DSM 109850]|uniref:4Fe-4S ferredoxin-type domain-containing protein n=2 Tax=Sulfobacillus harzensis TaxID=2729629 RepID=A0A7Y0L3G9_9FIRM|nr:hypothetical protein [Sulfobacillus harzensis]